MKGRMFDPSGTYPDTYLDTYLAQMQALDTSSTAFNLSCPPR